MRPLAALLVMTMTLAACGSPVQIVGEAAAIGAKVLVDGKEAAVMEKRVYAGGEAGPAGKEYAAARLRVPAGARRITVVSADGRKLEGTLDAGGDAYLTADFAKGELRR